MLQDSTYPPSLKQRIGGPYGHMSNHAISEILRALDQTRLKKVIGAHLSSKNNTEDLARQALCGAVSPGAVEVTIACQEDGFDWIEMVA